MIGHYERRIVTPREERDVSNYSGKKNRAEIEAQKKRDLEAEAFLFEQEQLNKK